MRTSLHATALVLGEKGLLIEGKPGAGKSALAERIIAEARAAGLFARLVGDDRVIVERRGDRLIVAPHAAIAGRIERRGIGIVEVPHEEKAVLRGILSLEEFPERMLEENARFVGICGVSVPRLVLRADKDLAARAHLAIEWMGS